MMKEQEIPVEDLDMDDSAADGSAWKEELQVTGDEVLGKVQELMHEAAVRKITVKDSNGKTLLSLPLYAGIAGVLVMGPWTALALVGAWLGNFSIIIEYEELDAEEIVETAVKKAQPAAKAAAKPKEDTLRAVNGIGPKTAEKLAAAGVTTIDKLAKMRVDELMRVAGVNQQTAEAWIKQAKSLS